MLTRICELAGWQEGVAEVPLRYVAVDVGKDLNVTCAEENAIPYSEAPNVMWVRQGREEGQTERLKVETNGMLKLLNVSVDDAGNYSCTLDDDLDAIKTMINVTVRSMFELNYILTLHETIYNHV